MVFEIEYEHHDRCFDFRVTGEKLLKFKDKKILVVQRIKLEDITTKIGSDVVISMKESEKYAHVIGFVKDDKYKYRSYKGFGDKTIFVTEIESSCIQYKKEIKKLVKDSGFIGRVSFESPEYFLHHWDPIYELL